MKANEFIKSVGIEKAIQIIQQAQEGHNKYDLDINDTVESYQKKFNLVRLDQLKNLVKSHNIIDQLGGYEKVKKFLSTNRITSGKYLYFDRIVSNIIVINTSAYGALHIEYVSEVFNKVESCK